MGGHSAEKDAGTRIRYTAEYDYPGSFFPKSTSRQIVVPTFESAVTNGPNEDGYFRKDGWYAVTIRAVHEKRFTASDGAEAWVQQRVEVVGKFVVGERVHHESARLAGPEFDILRSDIRANSEDGYGVLTRCGNWQIASDYTRVLPPAEGREAPDA